jgi:hypothetical protein
METKGSSLPSQKPATYAYAEQIIYDSIKPFITFRNILYMYRGGTR